MDEAYFKGLRNITKQLEGIGFPDANDVAMYIMEAEQSRLELSYAEMESACYILELINSKGNARVHPGPIARAICKECSEIKKVYNFLVQVGYSKEKLQDFYSKEQSILYYDLENIKKQYEYLGEVGLTSEQVKELFLDTVYIGPSEVKERCETVLRYFDEKMIYHLGNRFLFYGYYTDPVDCIEYVVDRLGIEKAEEIFLEQDMLLYLWKERYQRDDISHGPQHREAMALIEKYEKN